ncbi:MAG: aminotransferase class V-fold PLP-dependent enzyme [Emcibacter sp.]|nr:aminotransferase class V-fold PLP-dependent enzyme [Emcibacter sp.]
MNNQCDNQSKLIEQIRQSIIGEGMLFQTPFGLRPLIYADYTASGRSLTFIENYLRENILPFYANTHSVGSVTGRQTTAFREEARSLIRKSLKASDQDAVIFCGSGATSAIQKIIEILNIRLPAGLDDQYGFSAQISPQDRPVIFVGSYEHHSNELAWRESIADMVVIPLNKNGGINTEILEIELEKYQDRPLKIGSFSAASNVTGLISDVKTITRLLHQRGALAFWDYAAAGPYVPIDVSGVQDDMGDTSLDALYISPHKFIGGPGTPGVLVIKRKLMTNRVPSIPGGGTVSYVSPTSHRYLPAGESKEEGGTPAIVESIRAGMVFQLKDAVGAKTIEKLEHDMVRRAIQRWSKNSNIQILGNLEAKRISIISFLIIWQGKPLHFGFVDALINDLFGIQVRGGCSCAGPYGHELLGINMVRSQAIADAVDQGYNILKPGWLRLNFNYFIDEESFEYLLKAVELIALYGWKLLGQYQYDPDHGVWRFGQKMTIPCRTLGEISYDNGAFQTPPHENLGVRKPLSHYLEQVEAYLKDVTFNENIPPHYLPEKYEELRWYITP